MNTMYFVLYALVPMSLVQIAYAFFQPAENRKTLSLHSLYPWLALYWVSVVAFRPFFMSPDDANYFTHLNYTTPMENFKVTSNLDHSPLYYWILGGVRRVFGDNENSYLLLAGTAALAKFTLIGKLTRWDALAALMYVGIFLILHDMVQFRVALALAFVLAGLFFLDRRRWFLAAAAYAPAIFVHSQTAAFALVPVVMLAFGHQFYLALGIAAGSLVLATLGLAPTLPDFIPLIADERTLRALDSVELGEVGVTAFMMLTLTAAVTPFMKSANIVQRIAFYSVISGFLMTWLTIKTGASSRLAHMFWMPLCLLAPLTRANHLVKYLWVFGALSYFVLSTYINELLVDWRIY